MVEGVSSVQAGEQARVRIGVVGCGGRAGAHLRALQRHPEAEIVAVADVAESAAAKAGEALGVPHYTDHRALLARDDLDAVWISVPVFAHGALELAVIERGLPFFVEKPVARDLETALRISAALDRAGLWAAAGYQLRYGEGVRRARAYVAGRTVALVEGHYWSGTGRHGGWVADFDRGGGQLVEQATHTVDLMRYIAGEVAEVYARQTTRVLREITAPDTYTVSLRFSSGALGTLSASWVHDPDDWAHANVLHFGLDGCLVRIAGQAAELLPASAGALPEVESIPGLHGAFLAAVRDRAALPGVLSPYRDAVATLAVSLAANASAAMGRPVSPLSSA